MQLCTLFIEDSEDDADLLLRELKRIGYEVKYERVETASAMQAALRDREWDVVICDYSLPAFNAPQALEVLKASGKDLPFIILSGTIGEETAVAAMKAGAHDFLLKGNLVRLGPVIERELREARIRQERTQADQELIKRERRFHSLIVNGVDFISLLAEDGSLLWESPSTTRMLGYEENEFVGKNIMDIVHPDDLRWIQDRYAKLMSVPGSQDRASFRLRHQDGSWRWVDAVVTNLLEEPSVQAVVINYHDVTDRKQAEEALLKSEEEYRLIAENADDWVYWVSPDGNFRYISPSCERVSGYSPAEFISEPRLLQRITHPDDQARLARHWEKTREQNEPDEMEFRIVTKGGETRWIHHSCSPIFDPEGNYVGRRGTNRNITERKHAEFDIQQYITELETLYESGLAISQLMNPKEIAQKVIDLMSQKLDWHHTAVRLYNPEDESLELLAYHLPSDLTETKRLSTEERLRSMIAKAGTGLTGWAVQQRRIVRVDDLLHDPRYIETFPGLRSGLYIPLQVSDRMVGAISIESEKPNAFSDANIRLTATLANQAAVALENARLHEETLRQLQRLQSLHAIDTAISSSFNQNFTLDVLLSHAMNQLGADAASILLLQPHQQILNTAASKGFHGRGFESTGLRVNGSFAGRAIVERRMIHATLSDLGTVHPTISKIWSEEDLKSQHLMPLIAKGEAKGVLGVFFRRDFTPDPAWNNFLETLAGQAAIAIDNTQMFDGLQRANMELAVAYDATIEGWSQAMDLRDKETEGHTQRVTKMAVELAKAMRLGDEELVHIRRGALLHDIGKLGVPDNILLKPEKLTDAEWQIMRQHPQFAFDMLKSIAYLRRAVDIPYCHHEKWDGTGYPRGLKGEQIPLAARIFAVADVWDAVTSDRPYRKAWEKAEALKYIREQSGKHFDPAVVDMFLKELGSV